jgi:hypothetical protein
MMAAYVLAGLGMAAVTLWQWVTHPEAPRGTEPAAPRDSEPALLPAHLVQMRVQEIAFSKGFVYSAFSNGSSLCDVQRALEEGTIGVNAFPPLRVVLHEGRWVALDNRRLHVFKHAGVAEIPVMQYDSKDPVIRKEVSEIDTNTGRTVSVARRISHFTCRDYVFNKRVLQWTDRTVAQPCSDLPTRGLENKYPDRGQYYQSFEPLIFEEARTLLHQGITAAIEQQVVPYELVLAKIGKPSRNADNPQSLSFASRTPFSVKPGDVFLMEFVAAEGGARSCRRDQGGLSETAERVTRLFAMGNPSALGQEEQAFKMIIPSEWQGAAAFQKGARWRGVPVGSLLTLRRIYEAVTTLPETQDSLLEHSVRGVYPWQRERLDVTLSTEEQRLLESLNPPQQNAIKRALRMSEGLQLLQGPPGTGKTTTVVKLLRILQQRGERVLMCAPSNKAVQTLAERFIQDYPDVPVVLVGVEDKLPPNSPLEHVFLDTWAQRKEDALERMIASIQAIQQCLPSETSADRLCYDLGQVKGTFSAWVLDVSRYPVVFSKGVREHARAFLEHVVACSVCIESYRAEPEKEDYATAVDFAFTQLIDTLSALQALWSAADITSGLLQSSRVLFMTLSVSGQQRIRNAIGPIDALIVDEAGQSVEAETLIPFQVAPRKCVLIGDTKQLPATVLSQAAVRLRYDRSMMSKLIGECAYPDSMLTIQHRMHPAISSWPSRQFYAGRLTNHVSVSHDVRVMPEMQNAPPFLAPYAFIDVQGREELGPAGSSFVNKKEIESVRWILEELRARGIDVASRVGIISFYKAQVDAISSSLRPRFAGVKVNTVDGFQGGENDIIIISCVRANRGGQVGFLRAFERLNVALTRAKFSLIVLGDAETLKRGEQIGAMVQDAQERGYFYPGSELAQLKNKRFH